MEPELRAERRNELVMYAVLLAIVAAFFLSFFNRFAGLRSGAGEYTAGVAFLDGRMPYRDYFTTAPPLNLLKSALLLKVFGEELIVSRIAGVMERLLMAAVLFRWLRQIFRRMPSLIASALTLILSAGDRTDPIASYNHDAIFYAMLSGLAASLVLSERKRGWPWLVLATISGCFAALSILTKQTVGLGSACTVFAVTALLLGRVGATEGKPGSAASSRKRRMLLWLAGFAGGCMLPLAIAAFLLAHFGLLHASLQMLFVKGPAAKATHASDFLVRELRVGWDNFGWLSLGACALLLSWKAIWRATGGSGDGVLEATAQAAKAGYVLAAGLGMLAAAEALRSFAALHDFSKSSVYFTLLGLTMLIFGFAGRMRTNWVTEREAQCVLLCAVSWSVAVTLSLSWPAFEAMLLPGFGFLTAAVMEGVQKRRLPVVWAALCFLALMQMREKLDLPFGFDYQDEAAVRTAGEMSTQPQLRGMRLPHATTRFLDETVATIQRNTHEGERIFVYPEMGLLYALSSRTYPTQSGSHNIDVLNDGFAAEEARRLRVARPAVLIYYRETEQQQRSAERLWRSGRPSGQRALVETIEEMLRGYRLAGSYRLIESDPEILVYVRR